MAGLRAEPGAEPGTEPLSGLISGVGVLTDVEYADLLHPARGSTLGNLLREYSCSSSAAGLLKTVIE